MSQDNEPPQDSGSEVTIYTSMLCPFCHRAKHLLKRKGVNYREIDVTLNSAQRSRMTELAGGIRTVPQIFIGSKHVGGCDELHELERQGRLDALLSIET